MGQQDQDRRIDDIEPGVDDIGAARRFHGGVFGWKFTDIGPDCTSFEEGRLAGRQALLILARISPSAP